MIVPDSHEKKLNIYSASDDSRLQGERAVAILQAVCKKWQALFPGTWIKLVDRYGVAFYETPGRPMPSIHYSLPLTFYEERFGTLYSQGPLSPTPATRELAMELSGAAAQLEKWGEIEGERRGEKVSRLLAEGLQDETYLLMQLCNLSDPPWTVTAVQIVQPLPFQQMHLLRQFLLAHLWRYDPSFPFLGWRPNGMWALLPETSGDVWATRLSALLREWSALYPAVPIAIYWDQCPAASVLVNRLHHINRLMDFAAHGQVSGLLNQRFDRHFLTYLANISPENLRRLVVDTLGPLLSPEHQDTLRTLYKYLEYHQSVAKVAGSLFVHKNTVIYRIHQAEQILNQNFKDTNSVAEIWIALQAMSLLDMAPSL